MSDEADELADDTVRLANDVGAFLSGHDPLVIYGALSMIIGAYHAHSENPNIGNLLKVVGHHIEHAFTAERASLAKKVKP